MLQRSGRVEQACADLVADAADRQGFVEEVAVGEARDAAGPRLEA